VASPHFVANIASSRNVVEQHHFERSEKHHITAGDTSLNLYANTLVPIWNVVDSDLYKRYFTFFEKYGIIF